MVGQKSYKVWGPTTTQRTVVVAGWFGDLILSAQPSFLLTHYHYGYVLIQCLLLLLLLLWALTMARDIIMGCPN